MAASPEASWDGPSLRVVGAALGVVVGPAVAHGASFGALGFTGVWVGLMAAALGALLGALSWGQFVDGHQRPGPGFASLFGAVVGLLAGGAVAFPMGAIFGVGGGAAGAMAGALVFRLRAARGAGGAVLAALFGTLVCAAVASWMAS
jgi:hypothetical protein